MGVFGDNPTKDRRARANATKAKARKEAGETHALLGGSVDALVVKQMETAKRQSVMPLSTLPYAVTSFYVALVKPNLFKWTLKAIHEELGGVYMHGEASSVHACVQAMAYCVAKGDWRLDKYPQSKPN